MNTRISQLLLLGAALAVSAPAALSQQTLFTVNGGAAGGSFGGAVAIIGDVNGDNRDDIIVGMPTDNTNGYQAGRAVVVSGLDGSILYHLFGTNPGDQFGFSVCAFGADLDGDSIPDFAVGAPLADPGGVSNAGQVKVFSGANGAVISTFNGSAAGDRFGYSIASAGNTAGAYRIVIGAPYRNQGASTDAGAAYVYFASGGFLHEYTGSQTGEHCGWSVAGGEDTNSDGTLDIAVGSPDWDDTSGGLTNAGRVRVYSAVSPYSKLQEQSGGGSDHRMGAAVALLKKWDSDTAADIAVGMPGAPFGATDSGGVYIFSGASGAIIGTLTAFGGGDHGGTTLAAVGDINNDGRTDLAVGAPDADAQSIVDSGQVKVFAGNSGSVLITINGFVASGHLGAAVGGGGDVNNDNRADVVIGTPNATQFGNDTGHLYAISGLSHSVILSTYGPVLGDEAGTCVANVGDVNGDGKDDFAVGFPRYDAITGPPFPFYIWNGGKVEIRSGADNSLIRTHSDLTSGGNFGFSIAGLGDVNGDGRPDYAIGQPKIDAATAAPGEVFIYSGMTGSLITSLAGTQNGDYFGYAVSGCGDVNGNGQVDVLIGLPKWDNGGLVDAGRVEAHDAVSGNLSLSRSGLDAGAQLGYSVAGLFGDINNDGLPDVVAGAPFFSTGGANRGRVYVLSQPLTIVYTIDGSAAGDELGYAVAGAGDLNFDGKVDFVATAPFSDAFVISDGGSLRAFSGYNGAGLFTYIGLTNEHVGRSVAKLGDLDGDGVAEIAVGGTPFNFIFPTAPGFVDVVSGRFGTRNYRLTGESVGDGYGNSVAGMGDVTGDGLGELVVGAPYADLVVSNGGYGRVINTHPLGTSNYGTGTLGCQGTTRMMTNGPAKIGNSAFRFHSDKAPASALGLLLVTDVQDVAGTDLFNVGVLIHAGLVGAVDVYAFDMNSDPLGYAAFAAALPNAPALVGKHYYAQSIWAWQPAECSLPPYQLSSSQGLAITIQN